MVYKSEEICSALTWRKISQSTLQAQVRSRHSVKNKVIIFRLSGTKDVISEEGSQ